MDTPSPPASSRRASLARAIVLRIVVWGGMLGLVVLFFGNLRFALPCATRPRADKAERRGEETLWPQQRGPHGTAIADEGDLADAWPAEGPPVLWTRELGQGYSAFIGVGGRVYTQTQDLSSQSVICLEADTGRLVWEHRYGWSYEAAGMYPGPRATPTWHAGRIYFASPTGLVGCLRDRDGQRLWSVNVNERFAGRGTDFGYSCSPLIEDGKVILPVGGSGASVVALNVADGSTVWASGDEPASYCSAATMTLEGRRLVVAFLQNALTLLDPATGRRLWQQHYSSGYDEHAAQPLYEEPYLMVAGPFRAGADAYRLELQPAGTTGEPTIEAKRVWHSPKLSNDTASSVLIDGYVYGFDLRDVQAKAHRPSRGEFRCLELRTGKVCWSTDQTGHATVIAADGKLLLLNDKGELLLARVSPQGYEELGRTQVFSGEICWTAPALYRGCVYLRSPKRAACVYVGDPSRLDQRRRAQARPTTQLATPRSLDWTWLVGGEREYAFDLPDARELRLWYSATVVGVLGLSALGAALLQLGLRRRGAWANLAGRLAFWGLALVLSLLGTPIFTRLCRTFVFTWPLSLFVTQQLAFVAILWARRQSPTSRFSLLPLVAGFAFLTVCLSYFQLCRSLGLAPLWLFLLGFLPSWPVAIPAAYRLSRHGSLWRDLLWTWAGFSLYFASCAAYIVWRS